MAAVVGAAYLAAQEDTTRPAGYGHRLALVRERGKVLCADNTELAAWSWIGITFELALYEIGVVRLS